VTYSQFEATHFPVAEPAPIPTALSLQRKLLAACIILAPLSITLTSWRGPKTPHPLS
jgi:hypothetical protein